jgi:hypothetical protein
MQVADGPGSWQGQLVEVPIMLPIQIRTHPSNILKEIMVTDLVHCANPNELDPFIYQSTPKKVIFHKAQTRVHNNLNALQHEDLDCCANGCVIQCTDKKHHCSTN